MSTKHSYTYAVLRYVHDVVTGEFVNAGIVMYSPGGSFLKIRTRSSIGRIRHIFPDLDRAAFLSSMKAVERAVKKLCARAEADGGLFPAAKDVSGVVHTIMPQDDSSLQWSSVSGGVTDDLEKVFDRTYSRLINRYDSKSPHRRSDDEIWRPVRALLEQHDVPVTFSEKVITGENDSISFKRAWKNGRWHAYEPLSFDLADAEGIKDKARRWRGHLEAVRSGISDDINLYFLVGAPGSPSLMAAYKNAIRILEEASLHPTVYEENQIPQLVSEIEDEVRAHSE